MRAEFPTISCIIPTYNSAKTIALCLQSIRQQNYPQDKIETIIVDGGSKDDTLRIAHIYGTKIISTPPSKQTAEYNKAIGVKAAKNELLLILDSDNILPHNNWLKNMVQPLLDDHEIVGVDTLYIHYDKKFSLLDRYVGLYGSLDPVAYYIGNVDKLSRHSKRYNLYGQVTRIKNYYSVVFRPDRVPAFGSNGFLIRRKLLIEHALISPKYFSHIDVNVDLIKRGYNKYAFIIDDIVHLTGSRGIIDFLKRRKMFMEQNTLSRLKVKRYSVVQSKDIVSLIKYIFYTATFIKPLYDAFSGYRKIKDIAWFFHPFLCYIMLGIYSYVILKYSIQRVALRFKLIFFEKHKSVF